MNIRDLDAYSLITVLADLRDPKLRALIVAEPKLAPYLPDFDADHAALVSTSVPAGPVAPSDPAVGPRLDRRAESAVRAAKRFLEALTELAIAQGDDDRATRLAALDAQLFEDGLGFLRASWNVQLGATERLVERARLTTDLQGLTLNGVSWQALIELIAETNAALRTYARREVAAPVRETSLTEVRRQAQRNLAAFVVVLDNVLPASDPASAERRAALRAPFMRVRSRPSQTRVGTSAEPAQPTPTDPGAPPAAPAATE